MLQPYNSISLSEDVEVRADEDVLNEYFLESGEVLIGCNRRRYDIGEINLNDFFPVKLSGVLNCHRD